MAAAWLVAAATFLAAVAIPPKPERHFDDRAGLVSAAEAQGLDATLRAFEEETGSQIVVAVFPELPSGAALEDFTVRTAQAWGAGRAKEDDGAVLFVFVKDRRSRLEVGYGLEDRIPDAVAKRIVQDALAPRFREEQYAAGLRAAVEAILAAVRGQGPPPPVPQPSSARRRRSQDSAFQLLILAFVFLFFLNALRSASRRGRRGWTVTHGGWYPTSGGWHSGGSWGGWGGGGGGGGGFSGGGGSFGGGGASGDW